MTRYGMTRTCIAAFALCAALGGCGGSDADDQTPSPPAPIAAPATIGQPQSTPSYEAAPVPPRELMERQP